MQDDEEDSQMLMLMKLPCGHVFHKVCVERWFSVGRTCPNCRQEVFIADGTAASGPSTHRSIESGEDLATFRGSVDDLADDLPKRLHCLMFTRTSAAPTPLRPAVPVLPLGGINRKVSGSDPPSPLTSKSPYSTPRTLSARGENSGRLTMSPRSAFTDAPPKSHRSTKSEDRDPT
jgi:hypothetical protein